MTCVQLHKCDSDEWDGFAAGHRLGTIYHGSDWKRMVEETYPHIKGRLIALRDSQSGAILAGIPVYHVSSRLLGDRLVTAPHATWCDPLVSDERQLDSLLKAVESLAIKLSIDRIEIKCRRDRHFPLPNIWTKRAAWKHHYIQLEGKPIELWERLSLNSVRQLVKRADKKNVVITAERGEEAVSHFYAALLETRKRLKLPMIPYRHFSNIDRFFSRESVTIYLARIENQVLGAALTLSGNRRCHLELTGEHPTARPAGAMQSLIWTAVKNADEDGCTEFSFGRTDVKNSGLLRYKRGWSTDEEDFSVIERGFSSGSTSSGGMAKANAVLRVLNGIAPRPVYKLMGSFLYRHWG